MRLNLTKSNLTEQGLPCLSVLNHNLSQGKGVVLIKKITNDILVILVWLGVLYAILIISN